MIKSKEKGVDPIEFTHGPWGSTDPTLRTTGLRILGAESGPCYKLVCDLCLCVALRKA